MIAALVLQRCTAVRPPTVALARLLLVVERRRLERVTLGPYDAVLSYRLDGVVAALEALR